MMKYDSFKEAVTEQFLSQMPDDFADYKVEVNSVIKVNRTEDRLQLLPPENIGVQTIPSISLNQMYEDYQSHGNLEDVIAIAAFHLARAYRTAPQDLVENIMDNARDRVVMMLINTELNQELLKTVPHREFRDLSIVYRLVADIDTNGIQTAMIQNELAEHLGMDEQALYMAALQNTKRLFPPVIKSMNDVIREMFASDSMDEFAEMMVEEIPADRMMYVISNSAGINGAVSMLYENELHTLAQHLETDLYILPSSIHEVIAVSADIGNPRDLAQMVEDINLNEVALADRLSNQVYYYDKDLRKITMAKDKPNKKKNEYGFLNL